MALGGGIAWMVEAERAGEQSTVVAATPEGYEPFSHADYEPGRRFYFLDRDGIEFEVISYA